MTTETRTELPGIKDPELHFVDVARWMDECWQPADGRPLVPYSPDGPSPLTDTEILEPDFLDQFGTTQERAITTLTGIDMRASFDAELNRWVPGWGRSYKNAQIYLRTPDPVTETAGMQHAFHFSALNEIAVNGVPRLAGCLSGVQAVLSGYTRVVEDPEPYLTSTAAYGDNINRHNCLNFVRLATLVGTDSETGERRYRAAGDNESAAEFFSGRPIRAEDRL